MDVLTVLETPVLTAWLKALRDRNARVRIEVRIVRMRQGNIGPARNLGGGISELKIDYGPGYRVYFTQRGATVFLLLCGGDKSSQSKDIERARILASEWAEGKDDAKTDIV